MRYRRRHWVLGSKTSERTKGNLDGRATVRCERAVGNIGRKNTCRGKKAICLNPETINITSAQRAIWLF